MRIRLAIPLILLAKSISSIEYEVNESPIKTLELIVEGYLEGPPQDSSVLAAIKSRGTLFERLFDNWANLISVMNATGSPALVEQPFFGELRSDLTKALGYRKLDGKWQKFLENILNSVNECYDSTIPSSESKQRLSELIKEWSPIISENLSFQELLQSETLIRVKELQNELKDLYKLDTKSASSVRSLSTALKGLERLVETIKNKLPKRQPARNETQGPVTLLLEPTGLDSTQPPLTLGTSAKLSQRDASTYLARLKPFKPLFAASSSVHKYIDNADFRTMEYLELVKEELEDFAKNGKLDILVVIDDLTQFHSLKGFKDDSPYYQSMVRFGRKEIFDLLMEMGHYFNGLKSYEVFLGKIHKVYTGFKETETYERNITKEIFKIYLKSFKDDLEKRKSLKESISASKSFAEKLMTLVADTIEPQKLLLILINGGEDSKATSNTDEIASIFDLVTADFDVLDHRKAHLGYVAIDEGLVEAFPGNALREKIDDLKSSLLPIYFPEILRYLEKEEKTLSLTNGDNTDGIDPICKRLSLIRKDWLVNPLSTPEKKIAAQKLITSLKGTITDHGSLASLHHRYIFPLFDSPTYKIQKNIEGIIRDLKRFLRMQPVQNSGFVFGKDDMNEDISPVMLFMELAPFLHGLKHRFEYFSFLKVKLSPFEEKLRDLANNICFVKADEHDDEIMPKNDDDWRKVNGVFQDWLRLLESWKLVIEARNGPGFLASEFELKAPDQVEF